MNKVLEGMARAHWTSFADVEPKSSVIDPDDIEAMSAALLWLASNVTDEMVHHLIGDLFKHRPPAFKFEYTVDQTREAIAAALRAAAGDGK